MLEEMGVDSEAVLLQQDPTLPTDTTSCVPVQQRMANAYGVYDSGNLRYDLSIPQVFLRREARGYVNPALWDRGINAGFVGYSFNAIDSNSRVEGGQRNRSAYLGLNAGLNLGGWQFRHDSNLTGPRVTAAIGRALPPTHSAVSRRCAACSPSVRPIPQASCSTRSATAVPAWPATTACCPIRCAATRRWCAASPRPTRASKCARTSS